MNQEIKKEWVTALRSGKYTQGTGFLRVGHSELGLKHCCLGVLCELYAEKNGVAWDESEHGAPGVATCHSSSMFLPRQVQEWAGLEHKGSSIQIVFDEAVTTLSTLNDGGGTRPGLSFCKIAGIIEAQL